MCDCVWLYGSESCVFVTVCVCVYRGLLVNEGIRVECLKFYVGSSYTHALTHVFTPHDKQRGGVLSS